MKNVQALLCALACTLTMGCASASYQYRVTGEMGAVASVAAVPVQTADGDPRSYEILGKILIYKLAMTRFNLPTEEDLFARMARPAAEMGAEAVVGAYSSSLGESHTHSNVHRWASGLAVRWLKPPADPAASPLVVAIPPIALPAGSDMNADRARRLNSFIQEGAQRALEEKGYYARIIEGPVRTVGEETSILSLDAFAEALADTIFLMELVGSSESNIGIASGESVHLQASLYSCSQDASVWTNAASEEGFSLGLLPVLINAAGGGMSKTCYKATAELVDTIPAINAAYVAKSK